MKLFIT